MKYINESKIRHILVNYICEGNDSFIIFPYGTKGKMTKQILNREFGISELGLVDNLLSKKEESILNLDELQKIEEDYILLFACERQKIREELLKQLRDKCNKRIVDLASVQVLKKKSFDFIKEPLRIETCNEEQVKCIFELTQRSWEKLGEEDPYWSVVTHDQFRKENLNDKTIKKFYAQGKKGALEIAMSLLRTHSIKVWGDLKNLDILEIGCGCGRVTKSLAFLFRKVIATDISRGNLTIAKEAVKESNVKFIHLKNLDDYKQLPQTDVIYSFLVLQHNCPPVIEYMIDAMLKCLRPFGVAIFQIPTDREGYSFQYEKYIKTEAILGMEMHLLTQERIFEIAYDNQCMPLEVYPYEATGQEDHSTMFIFRKMIR